MSIEGLNDLFEAIEEEVKKLIAERDAALRERDDFARSVSRIKRETDVRMELLRSELAQVKSQLEASQVKTKTRSGQVEIDPDSVYLLVEDHRFEGTDNIAVILDSATAEYMSLMHERTLSDSTSSCVELEKLPVFYFERKPQYRTILGLYAKLKREDCGCLLWKFRKRESIELDLGSQTELNVEALTNRAVSVSGYNHQQVIDTFNYHVHHSLDFDEDVEFPEGQNTFEKARYHHGS